jgi:hypothetical protein
MCERSRTLISISYIYKQKLILLLIIIFFSYSLCSASDNGSKKEELLKVLIEKGFENICVKVEEDRVVIAFENRVYRFDVEAIKEALKIVMPVLNDNQKIILILENRKIPIIVIEAQVSDCKDFFASKISGNVFADKLKIEFDTDEIYDEIKNEKLENSSSMKFDLALKPLVNFVFGPYEHPVISQVNIVPELKTNWWKGVQFNYELIVPIVNEFTPREDSVRAGVVSLNQVFRLPNSFFVSTSVGFFTQNRYGFDLEARKYFQNGDMNLGFNFGYTSIAYFSGMSKLFYNDIFKWTGSLSYELRIPKYDLTLGLMIGRFLLGDNSIRFDINREFDEVEIGFFAIKSTNGISNGGINITIPLFPSKYWKPDLVRIKPSENFSVSYLVRSESNRLIGLRYNTENRLDIYNKNLNPSFIKNLFRRDNTNN